jgi:hypothetical protein
MVTIIMASLDRRRDDRLREAQRLRDDCLRAKDRAEIERRIQEERDRRQLAQARLVQITPPSGIQVVTDNLNRHEARFIFQNHGSAPVMGVEAEIWIGAAPLDQPCTSAGKPANDIVLSTEKRPFQVFIESSASELILHAWRINWSDSDGVEWYVDQPGQREPRRYTGQSPRPC